ncbi:hypothetical protein IQ13_1107 [Lacibacter cauensis]|uniref:Uncharacterized protein n=1 Tax=Lacibacter cauensis TaxID=510947 RepID=A0A562SNW4_9BACT|nr:hypothetical protein [Lacibacter cauensis]TWI83001.1 hypothetical protein IQ13_1107 [Lacibacter cauensis]
MKNYLLLLSLLLMAFASKAQVVTGVYKGKMEVDSPKYTVDFELTLKEKDGKLVGYCQRLFIVEDVLYYNLVKVTARIADSVLIVEDEKSVSNNFKEKTSGVKTVMFFKIQTDHDTVSVMPGEWSTSRTKKFLPITGSVSVSRERNYLATQLYKRLDEKQLTKEMLFEEKTQPKQSDIAANQPTNNDATTQQKAATKNPVQVNTTINKTETQTKPSDIAVNQNKPTTQQQQQNIVIDTAKNNATAVVNKPKPTPTDITVTQNKPTAQNHQQQTITQKDIIKNNATVGATKPKPTDVAVNQNKPSAQTQPQSTTVNKPQTSQPVANNTNAAINKPNTQPVDQKPVTPVAPTQQQTSISTIGTTIVENTSGKPVPPSKQPVINNPVLVTRQIEIIDALELSGDSVILSLYDNGEIDGDTVSVFLNNELLLSKIGLTANAFKKTIPINNGETIQLTLFAENLGRIPPNSGLLVITTNNERYQVHFTSTLNKNASVVLRRKE